ncbi:MAG: hypothetical protein ACRCTZ_19560 [Sarcina sp.]
MYGNRPGNGGGYGNGYGHDPYMKNESSGKNYYSDGWGNNKTKYVATEVDHVADKIKFLADIMESQIIAFDAVEQELLNYSQASMPPSPEVLRNIASRIDVIQTQVRENLEKMKDLSVAVDRATDKIQNSHGW